MALPGSHGDDLVSTQAEAPLGAGRVLVQDLVHGAIQLLDPLVQPEVLSTLHKEHVLPLIVTADGNALGPAHRTHHQNLHDRWIERGGGNQMKWRGVGPEEK